MADRYLLKCFLGDDEYPVEVRATEREILARSRAFYREHGPSAKTEIYLNDLNSLLYGTRWTNRWNRGKNEGGARRPEKPRP